MDTMSTATNTPTLNPIDALEAIIDSEVEAALHPQTPIADETTASAALGLPSVLTTPPERPKARELPPVVVIPDAPVKPENPEVAKSVARSLATTEAMKAAAVFREELAKSAVNAAAMKRAEERKARISALHANRGAWGHLGVMAAKALRTRTGETLGVDVLGSLPGWQLAAVAEHGFVPLPVPEIYGITPEGIHVHIMSYPDVRRNQGAACLGLIAMNGGEVVGVRIHRVSRGEGTSNQIAFEVGDGLPKSKFAGTNTHEALKGLDGTMPEGWVFKDRDGDDFGAVNEPVTNLTGALFCNLLKLK
jgi:hypothetical protein